MKVGYTVNKKLLFITTRLFWPTDSGRKLSLYYYCKGLHEKYNCDIYVFSFLEHEQTIADLATKPSFIKEVRLAKPIGFVEKIKNLVSKTFLRWQWPIQCSLFYSKENLKEVRAYCSELNPDYIFTDMIRTAMYYEGFSDSTAVKVLDMDDLLSKRYKRQLQSNIKSNIAGQYTGKLPKFIASLISSAVVKKIILRFEAYLTQKAEINYSKLYDKVIFVSERETAWINDKLPGKAVTIPVGVNPISEEQLKTKSEENTLTFVGNLKVAANIDSLAWIISDILPKIEHDVKFMVIGNCPVSIKEQYANCKNVIFTGRVDDLVSHVRRGKVFLSPLLYGTGIKTKILEAMAMGVPVVTNDVGVEGIQVENGKEVWVENAPEKIAERVDFLLGSYDTALSVANRARKVVEQKYNWDNIWNKFSSVLLGTIKFK